MNMDASNLPIDIHLSKLTEWLITRRICPRDWIRRVEPLRTRSQALIVQLEADPQLQNESQNLTSLPQIHYFVLRQLSERLRAVYGEEKTLFGSYKNSFVNEVMSILREYEKENVYLAEAAQILYRCVIYEAPAVIKDVAKHDQTLGSLQWNMRAWCSRSRATREKFADECRDYEIDVASSSEAGDSIGSAGSIEHQLREHLANLPQKFSDITVKLKDIGELVQMYEQFLHVTTTAAATPNKTAASTNQNSDETKRPLPVLRHVIEHGNDTVHEASHLLSQRAMQGSDFLSEPTTSAYGGSLRASYSRETSMSTFAAGHGGNQVVDEAEKRAFGTTRCASFLNSPSLLGKDLLVTEATHAANGGMSRHTSSASMIVNVNDETMSDRLNELGSETGSSEVLPSNSSGVFFSSYSSSPSASSATSHHSSAHGTMLGRVHSSNSSKKSFTDSGGDVGSSSGAGAMPAVDADASSVLTDETASSAGDDRGTVSSADTGGVEIDFSPLNSTVAGGGGTTTGELQMEVDITIEESGAEADTMMPNNVSGMVDADNAAEQEGGAGETILDNRALRGVLIDELYEVKSFISQRIAECEQAANSGGGSDDMLFGNLLSSDAYQKACNRAWLDDQKGRVEAVLRMLADPKLQILLQTKDMPTYPARVTEQLSQMVQLADRQLNRARGVEQQGRQLQNGQDSLLGQFDANLRFARDLQSAVESDISGRYDKRRVNIMSGVQSLHKPVPSEHSFSVDACLSEVGKSSSGGGGKAAHPPQQKQESVAGGGGKQQKSAESAAAAQVA